jgi:outer membrane murein-binding lipoprotein Lpp
MKLTNQSVAFLFMMLIVAVISIAGCSSTGIQRSKEATTTMQTMDNDIKLVVVQLDATKASLDELTRPGQSDVKKAFDLYTDNVSKIEEMEKDFAKHADEMQARGKDYFEEWQKEGNKYKNPQIQELSEQRRIQLGEIYGRIAENSIGVKAAFKTYVSDVKEIQIYVSNDLTPKGIEAIVPISSKVVNDGDNLKYAIKNVQTAIERARGEMSQGGM